MLVQYYAIKDVKDGAADATEQDRFELSTLQAQLGPDSYVVSCRQATDQHQFKIEATDTLILYMHDTNGRPTETIDMVSIDGELNGADEWAYAYDGNDWVYTTISTPGAANMFPVTTPDDGDDSDDRYMLNRTRLAGIAFVLVVVARDQTDMYLGDAPTGGSRHALSIKHHRTCNFGSLIKIHQ